jgi:hypothetical protein
VTYRFHGREDYWRFSDFAVREEFFDVDDVHADAVLVPPRIVGRGRKSVVQGDRGFSGPGA